MNRRVSHSRLDCQIVADSELAHHLDRVLTQPPVSEATCFGRATEDFLMTCDRCLETLSRPLRVAEIVEPFFAFCTPTPQMRMDATVISAIDDRTNDSRACFGGPVGPTPRTLDLWIRAQKPVQLHSDAGRLFQPRAQVLEILERRFRSLPSAHIFARFPRIGLDIDQKQNGPAFAQLR